MVGTRGFVGTKKNGIISGKRKYHDSFYDELGNECVRSYFDGSDILSYMDEEEELCIAKNKYGKGLFLVDGLYCEYGYVHNLDNDTLEIYMGFFDSPQWTEEHYLDYKNRKNYTHLITVIDKKIHSKELALSIMKRYEDENSEYPERDVINICDFCFKPLEVGKMFCCKKCEAIGVARKV